MRIGVISDTHARAIDGVPSAILKALETVDLIVHAGDFTEKAVLDGLKAMGHVKAVSGNMDSREVNYPQQAGGHLRGYRTCVAGWSYLHEFGTQYIYGLCQQSLYHQHCERSSRHSTALQPRAVFSAWETS